MFRGMKSQSAKERVEPDRAFGEGKHREWTPSRARWLSGRLVGRTTVAKLSRTNRHAYRQLTRYREIGCYAYHGALREPDNRQPTPVQAVARQRLSRIFRKRSCARFPERTRSTNPSHFCQPVREPSLAFRHNLTTEVCRPAARKHPGEESSDLAFIKEPGDEGASEREQEPDIPPF